MKNKQSLTTIAILVILLVGGIAFAKSRQSSTPQSTSQTTSSSKQKISDWLSNKQSTICTVKNGDYETTIYTKGGKVRVDGVSRMQNDKKSFFIQNDKYAYIWTEGQETGIKYPIMDEMMEEEKGEETTQEPTNDYKFNLKEMEHEWESMNYKCEPKSLDDSIFEPPTNIKFNDMSALMESMQNMNENPTAIEEQIKNLENVFNGN